MSKNIPLATPPKEHRREENSSNVMLKYSQLHAKASPNPKQMAGRPMVSRVKSGIPLQQ
jgi:hypothetical protein